MVNSASSTTVPSGAARLYVRRVGTGPTAIVLHGGPDFSHDYLLPDLDRLADIFSLVMYDQRGRGRSWAGERAAHVTLDGEIEDLDRIRQWSGAEAVTLIGHSWGAVLAAEYAARHPRRVEQLILMNAAPSSHADTLVLREHFAQLRGPELVGQMNGLRDEEAYRNGELEADAAYHRLHFHHALRRPEHLELVISQLRRGFTPEGIVLARQIEERLLAETLTKPGYDLRPRLARLRTPTLVLHGDHDFIPLDIARRTAAAIPGSELVVIPDCGHFAYLEQPDAVHAAIERFARRFDR